MRVVLGCIRSRSEVGHRILQVLKMIQGTPTKVVHWIEGSAGGVPFVVRVVVDAVLPKDSFDEPYLELPVLRWLEQVQDKADQGDVSWLAKVGDVFVRRTA